LFHILPEITRFQFTEANDEVATSVGGRMARLWHTALCDATLASYSCAVSGRTKAGGYMSIQSPPSWGSWTLKHSYCIT